MNGAFRKAACCLGLVAGMAASVAAVAAPADLDTGFSLDGKLRTDFGSGQQEQPYAVLVRPTGEILLAGYTSDGVSSADVALTQYTPAGLLDGGFGLGGRVTHRFSSGALALTVVQGAVLLANGKLLMVGTVTDGATGKLLLARLNADGSLDTGFGTDGSVIMDRGGASLVADQLAVQADGRIVVAARQPGLDPLLVVTRFSADGDVDTDFGVAGFAELNVAAGQAEFVSDLAIAADGAIVLVGEFTDPIAASADTDSFAARFTSAGQVDTTFAGGVFTHDYNPDAPDRFNAVALQPDGKLVIAGTTCCVEANSHSLAVRLNADGTPDTGFNGTGSRQFSEVAGNDGADAVAVLPDGKILLAGSAPGAASSAGQLIRLGADGSLDSGFGGDGIEIYELAAAYSSLTAVALQPDGALLVTGGGRESLGGDYDFVLARIENEAYDLTPDAFTFIDEADVDTGMLVTSGIVTISGLGVGVRVPVTVSGGEYALNAGPWTTAPGYVQNGDQIAVRHTAAGTSATATATTLTAGGLYARGNPNLVLGTTSADSFTSTTKAGSGSSGASGGGGSTGWLGLFGLLAVVALRRLRRT